MKTDSGLLDKLLTPSWLSGLIAVAAGLVVAVGVILVFTFNSAQFQQQLIGWQRTVGPALTVPGETPSGSTTNSLQNTWPLFGFWIAVGLVVYFIAESVGHGFGEAAEFKKELNYVHARRDDMIRAAFGSVTLRLAAVIVWIIFIELFFKRIIPYAITAAHASTSDTHSIVSLLYAFLSFTIMVLSMHLHTILIRLAAGRPRLFSSL